MKTKRYAYSLICLFAISFFACQKDEVIVPPQSQAEFTASATTVKVGEEIQFQNNSQNATSYLWSFGDGTTSKEVSPRKTYQSSNIYLVSLVSTGAGGSTIQSMEITVTPAASFTVVDQAHLVTNTPVQFTNTSEGATSYEWSFGDAGNATSTEENPTFTYTTAGDYTVSLTISGVAGESTSTQTITVVGAAVSLAGLYYIDLGDEFIRKLELDGSGAVSDIYDMAGKGGVGLTYSALDQKIYFSDFNLYPSGNIWRMDVDGTNVEAIVSDIGDPYAIAIDETAEKIYWVDDDGNVSRANLDGSSPEIGFFNVPGASWRALALDVENNKMYVYDANIEDLYAVDMDGSNAQIIISGIYGYAILVDTVNDKIYFDDQNDAQLKVADLDGTNIQMVNDNGTRIYGMAIDHDTNKLYWSGRDSGELYRADLDGANLEVLKTGLGSPRGIFLLD